MRPQGLRTRIFLDGGDPEETRQIIEILGFLDGQTTNPTLIAKSPEAKARREHNSKFTEREVLGFYRDVVKRISSMIPQGSVSVEVYADSLSDVDGMLNQGKQMFSWIPNAHIRFPISRYGLKAAHHALLEGVRVNLTLCFSQKQAAAVYAATKGARRGDVFVGGQSLRFKV